MVAVRRASTEDAARVARLMHDFNAEFGEPAPRVDLLEARREAGATHIELATGEGDVAAMSLYRSGGFTNREGGTEGPVLYYFEREL